MIPKISIIVPMYNVAKYVRAALISVQKQTFSKWECICVDDGSPDNCADIVAEFAAADPRIILVRQENGGVSTARNHGLELARGEYFTFLDPDDVYAPLFLEMAYAAAKYYDVDLVQMDLGQVPEDFRLGYSDKPFEIINLESIRTILRRGADPVFANWQADFQNGGLWCFVWRNLYRRSVCGGARFPTGIHPGEDDIYVLDIVARINSYVKLNEVAMYYRQSKSSVVLFLDRPENIEKKIANRLLLVRLAYRFIAGLPDASRFKILYYKMTMETLYRAVKLALETNTKSACDVLRNGLEPKIRRSLVKYCRPRSKLAIGLFFRGHDKWAQKILKIKKTTE